MGHAGTYFSLKLICVQDLYRHEKLSGFGVIAG
jgi:hypothetical protein